MQKPKKYDWKDSNIALFGSDIEKNVKRDAAETEPAWKNAGAKVGIRVWRIVKFKVTDWPKEEYGRFYNGDSYIVLNTYKDASSDELLYDVHFWIGKYSTQDEYGTAAYKTVELDTFLRDKPIQHREVQGHESNLFKSYFPTFTILKGGADSGFRKVGPKNYKPRLMHFKGERRNVVMQEVGLRKDNLTNSDVFILDLGLKIYQWNGGDSSKDERYKATQYLQTLKSERGGKVNVKILDAGGEGELMAYLNHKERKSKEVEKAPVHKVLFKLSDTSGNLKLSEIKSGNVTKGDFHREDVFMFDTAQELFVWVGSGASIDERRRGLEFAHNYLIKSEHPFIPVTVVGENQKSAEFEAAVAA